LGLYNRPLIFAHRCLYPGYPESTLLSLKKAIEYGCDYVEIDCRYTLDNHIVISHDRTINKCTNGKGNVREMTLQQLQKYNAGKGEVIPTVEEAFKIVSKYDIMADLDIKEPEVLDYEENPDENIPDLLIKYNLENKSNIFTGILSTVEFFRENPAYKGKEFRFTCGLQKIDSKVLQNLKDHNYFGINAKFDLLTKENVKILHDYSLEVQCFPENNRKRMGKLIEADVDVIQTDRMDLLIKKLNDFGHKIETRDVDYN
jgi:glycerophosphoryl diester phosphodiesterase